MKNWNLKTCIAIAIGITLALTDDVIIDYLGNHPVLGILFIICLVGLLFGLGSKNKVNREYRKS